MKDKNGKIIRAGDCVSYKGRYFDVIRYNGIFTERKKELKLMERKSMFSGAVDYWLNELKGEEGKIRVLKKVNLIIFLLC